MTEIISRPTHSSLGASGAERWMNCPGSNTLIAKLQTTEGWEPEEDKAYRLEGSAMHEAAAKCLNEHLDAWEIVGTKWFEQEIEITREMAEAVQVYLDACREDLDTCGAAYVEYPIDSPIHPLFYGTLDFCAIWKDRVKVRDFKGGAGIVVDVIENPQIMYYAYGLIDKYPGWEDHMIVDIEIVQPRAFNADGYIRRWSTTVGYIKSWVKTELVPAMERTEYDKELDPGEHCRFCPAKLICPVLHSLFRAAVTADVTQIINMSDETLGQSYKYLGPLKMFIKALGEDVERRLLAGRKVEGAKLVRKKADRVLKEGAAEKAKELFGPEAFTVPTIKGPPALEALGAAGKEFVKEWAYTPDNGLTVALVSDKRAEVIVKKSSESFSNALTLASEND